MNNLEQTILSQFGNSPTILALVTNMNEYIDPTLDLENFYNYVWNVNTAQGFGLDIWGRIVNVSRTIFTNPVTYLDDDSFRALILLKALSNITASTAPAINQLLLNWLGPGVRAYVNDLGNMAMRYMFEFALTPAQIQIMVASGIFLRPAGVYANLVSTNLPMFGFREGGTRAYTGFNQAPFFFGTIDAID